MTAAADIVLDLSEPGPDRAFDLRVFVETKLLLLRLRLLPRSGEFSRVAVRSLEPPLGEAFLAAARMSLGEFDRHVLGLDRLPRRR